MRILENIFIRITFAEANEFGDGKEMDKYKTLSSGKSIESLKKNNKCKGGERYATSR